MIKKNYLKLFFINGAQNNGFNGNKYTYCKLLFGNPFKSNINATENLINALSEITGHSSSAINEHIATNSISHTFVTFSRNAKTPLQFCSNKSLSKVFSERIL
jgi:hypothetical protein